MIEVEDLALSCTACGYALRGLPPDGSCPECGRRIEDSRQHGNLALAGTIWLRRVSLTAVCLGCVSLVGGTIYAFWLYDYLRLNHILDVPRLDLMKWYSQAQLILAVLSFVLLWFITQPPALAARESLQDGLRTWIRFLAFWAFVGGVAIHGTRRLFGADLLRLWTVITNLLVAGRAWLFWISMREWVRRVPDERLVRRCDSVKWGVTMGILFGPTLGALLHRQPMFSVGFRLFAPMPGRLWDLAYDLVAALLLFHIARRFLELSGHLRNS